MNNYRIVGLKDVDPETESEAVTLRTLNRKIQSEIEINNQLVAQKYLRLDGENQIVSDLQIYNYKPVELADATAPTDGVNKKVLDDAVNSLARLKVKDTLIILVQTSENRGAEIEQLRFRLNMETFRIDSSGYAM